MAEARKIRRLRMPYFLCIFLKKIRWLWLNKYLIGPFYAGPNLTPALFTPALTPPPPNFRLTPFRAANNAIQGEKWVLWKNSSYIHIKAKLISNLKKEEAINESIYDNDITFSPSLLKLVMLNFLLRHHLSETLFQEGMTPPRVL